MYWSYAEPKSHSQTALGAPNPSGLTALPDPKIMETFMVVSAITPMTQYIPFVPMLFLDLEFMEEGSHHHHRLLPPPCSPSPPLPSPVWRLSPISGAGSGHFPHRWTEPRAGPRAPRWPAVAVATRRHASCRGPQCAARALLRRQCWSSFLSQMFSARLVAWGSRSS
jgi:hypothetical protein